MKKIILFILFLPTILTLKAQLRYGFINQKGELVTPPKYIKVGDFNEGYAIVQNESNELLIIDKKGKETAVKNKNYVEGFGKNRYAFAGGLCAVLNKDKLGYINTKGEDVIPCTIKIDTTSYRYNYALPTVINNMIVMADGKGSFNFLDTSGNKVKDFEGLPPIVTIQNNVFLFGSSENYGLIDIKGKVIVKPEYTKLSINDKNIIIAKHLERSGGISNYYSLLSYNGVEIPNTRCNYISFFENGIALYKSTSEKNQWGIMDYKGNRKPFKENYQFKDTYKFSDREEIRAYFNNGYIVGQDSVGKDIILDAKGMPVTQCKYNFNRIKTISEEGVVLDYNAEKKSFTLYNLKTCKVLYDNIPEKYNSVFDLNPKGGYTIIKIPIIEEPKLLKFIIVDQFGNITFSKNENNSVSGGKVLIASNAPNIFRFFSELTPNYINANGKFLAYFIIGRDFKDGMSAVTN